MGRLTAVKDTHPSEKPAKTQKHVYEYDANGNIVYEYMRGNGTGQAKNETLYTYDALNRLVSAHDNYGNSTRTYTYDSLGNLTFETGNGSHNTDYRYNDLNQLVSQSDDRWKTYTESSYDKRGNLVLEEYHKNKKTINTVGQYTFDETNRMVRGINAAGEESLYSYNGLGALMENTWIIAENAYGYHGVNAGTSGNSSVNGKGNGNKKGNTKGNNGNGNVKKTASVIKQYTVDFTSPVFSPLTEREVNGLDYRYVYSDDARLSVNVHGIKNGSASLLDENGDLRAYYHCDYLGTTDYLTSAVNSKVISWTSYNEWGEITHNAVLKCGQRELDLVKEYATHDCDAVLNQYYAKARFYDADSRRFTAKDPARDGFNLYAYVGGNPVNRIDIFGLVMVEISKLTDVLNLNRTEKSYSDGLRFDVVTGTDNQGRRFYYNGRNFDSEHTAVKNGKLLVDDVWFYSLWKESTDFDLNLQINYKWEEDPAPAVPVPLPKLRDLALGAAYTISETANSAVTAAELVLVILATPDGAEESNWDDIVAVYSLGQERTQTLYNFYKGFAINERTYINTVNGADVLELLIPLAALSSAEFLSTDLDLDMLPDDIYAQGGNGIPSVNSGYQNPLEGCGNNGQASGITKPKGWKVGDPIDNLTKAGKEPSWSTVRSRFWKNEAYYHPEDYSKSDLLRMKKGKPPINSETGASMELHHINGRDIPNPHNQENLSPVWPWEHAEIDPNRHYTGPRPKGE